MAGATWIVAKWLYHRPLSADGSMQSREMEKPASPPSATLIGETAAVRDQALIPATLPNSAWMNP